MIIIGPTLILRLPSTSLRETFGLFENSDLRVQCVGTHRIACMSLDESLQLQSLIQSDLLTFHVVIDALVELNRPAPTAKKKAIAIGLHLHKGLTTMIENTCSRLGSCRVYGGLTFDL